MAKGRRKPVLDKLSTRDKFIELLRSDKSIDWERKNLGQRSLMLDIVYLLGVSVDKEKYSYFQGLRRFAEDCGMELDVKKVERPEVKR